MMSKINSLCLIFKVFIKAFLFKTGFKVRPFNVIWFITWRCNLACSYCNIGQQVDKEKLKKQELTLEQVKNVVRRLKKLGVKHINLTGGEPLLREDIFEIIKYCKENQFIIGITTNATLINEDTAKKLVESGIDHIHISLDNADETQDEIRNHKGMFAKVTDSIKILKKYCNTEKLGLCTVVSGYNLNKLDKLFKYAKEYGLSNIGLQPFISHQIRNNSFLSGFLVKSDEIGHLKRELKKIFAEYPDLIRNSQFFIDNICSYYQNPKMNHTACFAGGPVIQIFPEGNVGPCLYLESAGNLVSSSLENILDSSQFKEIVARVHTKKCPGCWCANIHEYNIFFKPLAALKSLKLLKVALSGRN